MYDLFILVTSVSGFTSSRNCLITTSNVLEWVSCFSLAVVFFMVFKYNSTASTSSSFGVLFFGTTAPYFIFSLFFSSFAIFDYANAVLSPKGKGFFTFHNAQQLTSYFIVVKHRNAIQVWSDSTISLSANSTYSYSFVDTVSHAYGNNLVKVDSSPIRFALYSGDVNQDGTVDITDGSLIDNDAFNFTSGYIPTDVNGDLIVDVADAVFADNNAMNFISVITP